MNFFLSMVWIHVFKNKTNFNIILFLGTELFVVRAFPRRLFNIQALDGVSIYPLCPCICVYSSPHGRVSLSLYKLKIILDPSMVPASTRSTIMGSVTRSGHGWGEKQTLHCVNVSMSTRSFRLLFLHHFKLIKYLIKSSLYLPKCNLLIFLSFRTNIRTYIRALPPKNWDRHTNTHIPSWLFNIEVHNYIHSFIICTFVFLFD